MLSKILKTELNKKQTFLFFCGSLLLCLLPLILANVPYYDDNNRLLHGKAFWDVDGRPLTDIVIYLLNFNIGTIGNIYPLPLLLSVIILAGALTYMAFKMSYRKNMTFLLMLIPIVINPFFLQNLSYQFDVIGMSFGISAALIAYFYNKKTTKDFIISSIFLAISFAFYQPCSNLFLCLFIVDILFKLKYENKILKYSFKFIGIYTLAVFLYYVTVFKIMYTGTTRHELIHLDQFIPSFYASWEVLNRFLNLLLNSSFLIVAFILIFSMSLFWLLRMFEVIKKINVNGIIEFLIILCSPIFLLLFQWGPLLLIEELLFNPREFPAFGILLFAGLLSLYNLDKRGAIVLFVVSFLNIYILSFCYQYGNSLYYQKESDKVIFTGLVNEINSKTEIDINKPIYLYGETPRSLLTIKTIENHPFIGELEKPSFRWVGRAILQGYGLPQVSRNVSFDDGKEWSDICNNNIKAIIKNRRYDVYEFKNHISVWLLKEDKKICEITPEKYKNIFSKNLSSK